jgi:hypothetical protein
MVPLRSTQLSPSSAVTLFAVSGEGMQEQKSRQPAGGKSSFSPNALCEMFLLFRENKKNPT